MCCSHNSWRWTEGKAHSRWYQLHVPIQQIVSNQNRLTTDGGQLPRILQSQEGSPKSASRPSLKEASWFSTPANGLTTDTVYVACCSINDQRLTMCQTTLGCLRDSSPAYQMVGATTKWRCHHLETLLQLFKERIEASLGLQHKNILSFFGHITIDDIVYSVSRPCLWMMIL
jgi:hypothetical protein